MRKVAVFLLILILVESVSCSAFFNRKVVTTKIYDEKIKTALLSPDKEILLIVNDSDELVLYNLKTDEVITKYELIGNGHFSHFFEWGAHNKIFFRKNFLDNNGEYVGSKQYETEDFIEFNELYEYREDIRLRPSKTYTVNLIQDIRTNKIKVIYSDGQVWDTGLNFDVSGYIWSNDDRYVFVEDQTVLYVLDTIQQKTINSNKRFDGKWAPTQNTYCFYADFRSRGFEEGKFYLFNPEKLKFTEFNTDITQLRDASRTWGPDLIWSPDSHFIAIPRLDKMFLLDAFFPSKEARVIVDFDGQIDRQRVAWSDDVEHILYSYETTTINPLKPFNFHVAKLNINTGKTNSIYIPGALFGKFFWIDNNTIIYELNHEDGLYKSVLRW